VADYLPDTFWDQYVENYRDMANHLLCGDPHAAERSLRRHTRWLIGLIQAETC